MKSKIKDRLKIGIILLSMAMCSLFFSTILINNSRADSGNDRMLTGKKWLEEGFCMIWRIEFSEDKVYKLNLDCMGTIAHITGSYSYNASGVTFHTMEIKEKNGDYAERKISVIKKLVAGNTCTLSNEPLSVEYDGALICQKNGEKIFFFDSSKPQTEGKEIVLGKTKVITMSKTEGVTLYCLKMREQPDTNSKAYDYFNDYDQKSDCIPKGKTVSVYARTAEKRRVQSWNNYWYLISAGQNHLVWSFGEFLKLKI